MMGQLRDLAELFKLRLTMLVLMTFGIGYVFACPHGGAWGPRLWWAMAGTAFVAASAAALNQWIERDVDARMKRTLQRPLPSGRMAPGAALALGLILAAAGTMLLWGRVNAMTALLGLLTLVTYLMIYTPLKRQTWWNTWVGAVPGAIPPMMGWTAARNHVDAEAWMLFAVLFLWQMPHFFAIAWICREDYARAGLKMLPVVEPDGRGAGLQSVLCAALLLPVSLAPVVIGRAGAVYTAVASAAGVYFLWRAVGFLRARADGPARRLFFTSLMYLPVVLGFLVGDRK
jgi:protoheme IX farnesyltransferase